MKVTKTLTRRTYTVLIWSKNHNTTKTIPHHSYSGNDKKVRKEIEGRLSEDEILLEYKYESTIKETYSMDIDVFIKNAEITDVEKIPMF